MALTDYSIDTSGTQQDVARRQALADALMKQGMDSSPAAGGRYGGWLTALNRGLSGALGGYQRGQADQLSQANRQADRDLLSSYPGVTPAAPSSPLASALTSPGAPAPTADTSGKIYSNDEPSPLDPPSGEDRRKMMATILGEENSAPGQAGVASVIRNRAVDGSYGGDTPSAVVTAKNQFEPWNTEGGRARMAKALSDPTQAAAADRAIASAYGEGGRAPEDPTEGKLMFYSPGAQAALGRPAPSWAKGEAQQLGSTMFYDDNSGTPANAQPTQGVMPPVQTAQADPQAARRVELAAWAQKAMLSSNAQTRQLALQTMEQLNKQQGLINAGSGKIYDPTTKTWLTPPKDPDADIPKNFEKGPDGELRPIKNGPADPDYIARAAGAKHPPGTPMDDRTADFLADRVLAGDTKALIGLGRGAQGAENLAKIQGLVAEKAKSGAPVSEAAQNILRLSAEQQGNVSAFRSLGTTQTKFGVAEKAAQESFPVAQAASDLVPRTQWKGLTELIQKGQTQINDPNLKRFLIATDTAVKDYARTINPTGVLRESDIEYARKILSTADSPEAYKAALDQLNVEVTVMHRAIQRQKDELKGLPDKGVGHGTPAAKPAPAVGDIVKGHKFLGGDPSDPKAWTKVEGIV